MIEAGRDHCAGRLRPRLELPSCERSTRLTPETCPDLGQMVGSAGGPGQTTTSHPAVFGWSVGVQIDRSRCRDRGAIDTVHCWHHLAPP